MSRHLKDEQIKRYVLGLTERGEEEQIGSHLKGCLKCQLRASYFMLWKERSCKKVHSLFERYYSGKLPEKERKQVMQHLKLCSKCFEDYDEFIKKKQEGIVDRFLGYLTNFPSLMPDLTLEPVTVFADSLINTVEIENYCELKTKDLKLTLKDDSRGNLKAYLESDVYDVSGVKVILGRKKKDGFESIATSTTSRRGMANLGKLKKIPPLKGRGRYAIKLEGLRKKGF